MKRLIYIIPVLVLALILGFTPACDKAVSTNEAEQIDETLEGKLSEEEAKEKEAEEPETDVEELIGACSLGNLEDVKRLLEQNADVNAKDNNGWTALMYAAYLGYTEIAEMLIDNGADVNAKSNDGMTALMWAALNNRTEIIKLLTDNGADVNAKSNDGLTALMYAAEGEEGYTETVNLLGEVEEEAVEESVEDTQSSGETTTQVPQGPSKATYLNNIDNIINEYNMAINHMNIYYEKIEFSNLSSFIDFERTFLDKIEEINGMLHNTTPASGYEGTQAHFIDLANVMYSQVQMTITYLEQENFDAADNMVGEFNKTFKEFVDYYNSL